MTPAHEHGVRRITPFSRSPRSTDAGFTLIELVIAVLLGGVIVSALTAALMTSLNVASAVTSQVKDSTDAGLIAAFFYRDAESAGAVEPTTARIDPAPRFGLAWGIRTDAPTDWH